MKYLIILVTLSQLCFSISSCAQITHKDSCLQYENYYDIVFKNKVCFLPDSLGGETIKGTIGVKVIIENDKISKDIVIFSIRLLKGDSVICKYYNNSIDSNNILHQIDKKASKYYDFISNYLIENVSLKKNKTPFYCDKKKLFGTFPLRIGKR